MRRGVVVEDLKDAEGGAERQAENHAVGAMKAME